jgi:hypothetical protein
MAHPVHATLFADTHRKPFPRRLGAPARLPAGLDPAARAAPGNSFRLLSRIGAA